MRSFKRQISKLAAQKFQNPKTHVKYAQNSWQEIQDFSDFQQVITMSYHNLPNLPGFPRPYLDERDPRPKTQSLSFKNGYMVVTDTAKPDTDQANYTTDQTYAKLSSSLPSLNFDQTKEVTNSNDVSGRYSLARKKKEREEGNTIPLPYGPSATLPAFLEHDKKVLQFNAYFVEQVIQDPQETERIRNFKIYFHLEDESVEIIEVKQENCGYHFYVETNQKTENGIQHTQNHQHYQNVFLKRNRGDPTNSTKFDINNFKSGSIVEFSGRKFHVLSCNESTAKFVKETLGWEDSDINAVPPPKNDFVDRMSLKMTREIGKPGVNRNRQRNDLKDIMESMLGKPCAMADRGKFLECGTDALRFTLVWDNRKSLYGNTEKYSLCYFLADDTIEICPFEKKAGHFGFSKFLKRGRIPKHSSEPCKEIDEGFFTWKDILIGEVLRIYAREFLVVKCDTFTRNFYKANGRDMPPDLAEKENVQIIKFVRQVPPYNGFGSEEDSLRTCTFKLNPPPLKKDFSNMQNKQGVLRFKAMLANSNPDDVDRRFVIQFFMEDDSLSIYEPPVENSGIVGGNFLKRQQLKKPCGTCYCASEFFVGNTIVISGHKFYLLYADADSYRIMECDEKKFPNSNIGRLHCLFSSQKDEINKYFVSKYKGDGTVDMDQFEMCCITVGLKLNKQEIITLWRKIDRKEKGKVSFTKVVKFAEERSMHVWE